jgi:hypothetical protein
MFFRTFLIIGEVGRAESGGSAQFTDTRLGDRFSIVQMLLRWRLGALIPNLDPVAQGLRDQVYRLDITALSAQDCARILDLTREIVGVSGLDPIPAEYSHAIEEIGEVMEKMQSGMTGSRDSKPLVSRIRFSHAPARRRMPGVLVRLGAMAQE